MPSRNASTFHGAPIRIHRRAPAKPAHKQISIKVTAKPGTTLYFLCAVHPWMQGKIVVK